MSPENGSWRLVAALALVAVVLGLCQEDRCGKSGQGDQPSLWPWSWGHGLLCFSSDLASGWACWRRCGR